MPLFQKVFDIVKNIPFSMSLFASAYFGKVESFEIKEKTMDKKQNQRDFVDNFTVSRLNSHFK